MNMRPKMDASPRGIMRLSLRPQERLFVNGAVLRVDRKVGVELLNDVTFLMENHVIQPEETRTPLRQLYFVVQTMLIDPANAVHTRALFDALHPTTLRSFANRDVIDGLLSLGRLVEEGRCFDGLKLLRGLFALEAQIIESGGAPTRAASPSPASAAAPAAA